MDITIEDCEIFNVEKALRELFKQLCLKNSDLYITCLLVDTKNKDFINVFENNSVAMGMMCEGLLHALKISKPDTKASEQIERLRLILNSRKLN